MKRYLLFAGEDCYPEGGWHDLRGAYANVGAAKRALPRLELGAYEELHWAHIVDIETGGIVAVWDGTWFRSMDERTEAVSAAFVKRMEERKAAGITGPFVASTAGFTAVPTMADLGL